jgi:serine/threonine protein kinase
MIPANPFVLRCHLAFETPTTVNMVCDLVEGGDLYFHLKFLERTRYQQGFFETQAVGILAELVLALGHLHRHNFLHRDLKIENIMLDGNGHVKLIDFGLACELTRNAASKNPDVPAGLYHPPEMLRVKPQERRVGCFTDWFSLGVVAFEVLMGVAQWSNLDTYYEDVEDAVQKLCTRPPYTIRTKNAGPFVARLLSRNYKRRLGTKGTAQVMKDPFFAGVDWEEMAEGRSTPGYVPDNFSMREVCKQRECAESLEKYRTFVEAQQAESSKPQQQSRSSWWTIARSLERVSTLPSIRLPYGDLGDETGGPGEHQ